MRRSISYLLLTILFAMLVVGAGATQSDPCLVYNTETISIVFDDVYTSAIPPVILARVDVEVLSAIGAPVAMWQLTTGWSLVAGAWKIPIRALVSTMANGDYQIRARVWDGYGNVSAWSETLWVSKQWRTLPAPGGCRTVS